MWNRLHAFTMQQLPLAISICMCYPRGIHKRIKVADTVLVAKLRFLPLMLMRIYCTHFCPNRKKHMLENQSQDIRRHLFMSSLGKI